MESAGVAGAAIDTMATGEESKSAMKKKNKAKGKKRQ